ncbi:MAG: hypothetical protein WB586_00275 [Chthoniobacterales bacterium]
MALFFFLFVQTGGLAIILWQRTPIYRRILEGFGGRSAGSRVLILATLTVGLMQGAYWLRTAIIPSLTLSPNVFLRHIVLFLGRLSFIFGAALFTAVMYFRFPELEKSIPRFAVLVAVLFSMFCYSLEMEWLALQLNGRRKV